MDFLSPVEAGRMEMSTLVACRVTGLIEAEACVSRCPNLHHHHQ